MSNVRSVIATTIAVIAIVVSGSRPALADENGDAPDADPRMTLRDVEALAGAGVADDVITAQVRATGQVFHLSTSEILRLHKRGVSGEVIAALVATGVRDDHVDDLKDATAAAKRELKTLDRAASRERVVVYGSSRYPRYGYGYRYYRPYRRHHYAGYGYVNPWHHYYSSNHCW